jgi:hypothetical protein
MSTLQIMMIQIVSAYLFAALLAFNKRSNVVRLNKLICNQRNNKHKVVAKINHNTYSNISNFIITNTPDLK